MDLAALLTYNIATAAATLLLASLGLAIIYGMMRVINLAHGEFMMLGAYTCATAHDMGASMWVAMLVLPPVVVGVFGVLLERFIIRFLYGRIVDTMLATWGISIAMTGIVRTMWGSTVRTIADPAGNVAIGGYSASFYGFVIIATAAVSLSGLYALMRFSTFGLLLRATMERPAMAAALGISPPKIYMATFGLGSALAGLAGGVLTPVSGISPTLGTAYVTRTFITVLGGGPAIVTGTGLASAFFGTIDEITSFRTTPVVGSVALMLTAIILIRLLPTGITGRFLRNAP